MRYCLTIVLALTGGAVTAATLVLSNATGETVKCEIHLGDTTLPIELAVGESRPITCARGAEITFAANDGAKRLRLDAYTPYLFVSKKKTGLELMTIELVGKSPGEKDIPTTIPSLKPLRIPVKLLVDDADPRTKAVWTATLQKRFEQARDIVKAQTGVEFTAVEFDEWTADPRAANGSALLENFAKEVKLEQGMLALGYTTRLGAGKADAEFAISRGLFAPHILLREGVPNNEPERVEVLVQQLGRFLGAVASPDPISVMRLRLGDGKAVHARFRIGFDPLNLLAVNIVAEQIRKTPSRKLAEWPQETQVRLARIYATLAAAMPEEPLNDEVNALLERAGLKAAAAVEPKAAVADPPPRAKGERGLSPEQSAIRSVVKSVTLTAEENARKPAGSRIKGDELTEVYIRAAADVAFNLDPEHRKKAFLIGIAVALDDTEIVRNKPGVGGFWKIIESDDERKVRLTVLGNPTVRYRRDWCQHFVVSAGLTALLNAEEAERIGIWKEEQDMKGPSGFSFTDLAADYAGILLAEKVLASGESLNLLRTKFTVKDFIPKIDDLPEGLSKEKFKTQYGDLSDQRFLDMLETVKQRVKTNAPKLKVEN